MAKKLTWIAEMEEEKHTVSLRYSLWRGKAIITIDADTFDISTKWFGLRGTNQAFKLGDEMAMLEFPKVGAPRIILRGETLTAEKE